MIYNNISYEYRQIYADVKQLSKEIEPKNSGNVGIFLKNSYDYIKSFFATIFVERIAVPLSSNSTWAEIKGTIEYCEITTLITSSNLSKNISLEEAKKLKVNIFLIDKNIYLYKVSSEKNIKKHPFETKYDEDSTCLLIHTSGSLSQPKRVMLSQKNILTNANSIIQSLMLDSNEITLIILPLHLISAFTSQLITHFYLEATIVLMEPPFFAKDFITLCNVYKVTNFTCVPTILKLLCMSEITRNDLSSVKKICFGGAPTSLEQIKTYRKKLKGIELIQMYGQTEAAARITHLLEKDFHAHIGSVGKPIPNVEISVINNEEDIICPPHKIGEICVRGNNVMKGYYRNEEKTREVLANGWLHTGDLGYLDDEGFLYLIGRQKNVIIVGGINVYPEEIEEFLLNKFTIRGIRVYGVLDDIMGEKIYVDIMLGERKYEEIDIINSCKKYLSKEKIPTKVNFVTSIATTESGKILRRIY